MKNYYSRQEGPKQGDKKICIQGTHGGGNILFLRGSGGSFHLGGQAGRTKLYRVKRVGDGPHILGGAAQRATFSWGLWDFEH